MSRTDDNKLGITWAPFSKLEDIEFTNDLCLLSENKAHLWQKMINSLL